MSGGRDCRVARWELDLAIRDLRDRCGRRCQWRGPSGSCSVFLSRSTGMPYGCCRMRGRGVERRIRDPELCGVLILPGSIDNDL